MKHTILLLIRIYQYTLSPLLGARCRYMPSCSAYMSEAVKKHGAWKGAMLGCKRILRCHPWGGYGVDPVPDKDDGDKESS
ncbi:MAG: membrane protein insertion efficiency factor YidD [Parvibaculales bacterium]